MRERVTRRIIAPGAKRSFEAYTLNIEFCASLYYFAQVVACMMGAYYGTLHAMHQWMVSKGVDPKAASTYVGAQMHSIALDGKQAGDSGFEHLIAEQTPGKREREKGRKSEGRNAKG